MPATLGQLMHVLEDVFSRIKHGSDIPGAPRVHSLERRTAPGCDNASQKPLQVLS